MALITIAHNDGPSAQGRVLINNAAPVGTGLGGEYVDLYLTRVDPYLGDPIASGAVVRLLASITASTSGQSVNVSDTGFMTTTPADYWIIEPGHPANQEVVYISAIADISHCTAIFRKNHAAFVTMRKVFTTYSKFLDWTISSMPTLGIENIGFVRRDPMPANVFDQYRLSGSVGSYLYTEDDQVPWISDASHVYDAVPMYDTGALTAKGNPSNGVVIDAGPQLGSGGFYRITPSPQVQLLFTSSPEPTYSQFAYRPYYDPL